MRRGAINRTKSFAAEVVTAAVRTSVAAGVAGNPPVVAATYKLTERQQRTLDYLKRVGGAISMTEMPNHSGGKTLETLAQRGLIEVIVRIKGEGADAIAGYGGGGMTMTSALRLEVDDNAERTTAQQRRHTGGDTSMKITRPMTPTTVGPKSPVGSENLTKTIRERTIATLHRFPTKVIEGAGDLTDEGVRLLKNGKRTISTETMVKLANSGGELGPAVWAMIAELCGRPIERIEHESPKLNALFGALSLVANVKGPEGAFARALIAKMNRDGESATIEVLPKKPPAASDWHPDNVVSDLFERRRA